MWELILCELVDDLPCTVQKMPLYSLFSVLCSAQLAGTYCINDCFCHTEFFLWAYVRQNLPSSFPATHKRGVDWPEYFWELEREQELESGRGIHFQVKVDSWYILLWTYTLHKPHQSVCEYICDVIHKVHQTLMISFHFSFIWENITACI